MIAEVNRHQARLYLVMGSKHMPVGGRVKRIANSGAGWLEAERVDNVELPGNIPQSPSHQASCLLDLRCLLGEDGKWLHLEAKMCCEDLAPGWVCRGGRRVTECDTVMGKACWLERLTRLWLIL